MLNFVCSTKNFIALRKYVLCNGVMNISKYFSHFSTFSVINAAEQQNVSYLKDGNDGQLDVDEKYPEWLWNLKGSKQNLNELDPHGRTYNRILRKKLRRDENMRRKMKRF